MRAINEIIVHCSATKKSMNIGVAEIDQWHREKGWAGCGYHFVIRRNGQVETGRQVSRVGAHCRGHNANSIGVCIVGGIDANGNADANFSIKQYNALVQLIGKLKSDHGNPKVTGHRDYAPKECPSFDVRGLLS